MSTSIHVVRTEDMERVRALRADPPRFEREPMCLECMKHAAERR